MNRWHIYSMLKGSPQQMREKEDAEISKEIYEISEKELREGVIEFLLMIKKNVNFELYK